MVCSIGRLYARVNDYAQDNYYTQNQELANSQWLGKGAEKLGFTGRVQPDIYRNAYQGLDRNGTPLRQRPAGKKYNPGRDITLSAPKSVSLLGLVNGEEPVIEAHQKAVAATLKYVEANCVHTRTGRGGTNHQQTDNALFAVFQHDDNRNQDPQLHSHCVTFNLTQGADGKWRTMDNRQLYQQKMTIGMVYHHELGKRLINLGYVLNWNRDGTFEVRGYSQEQLRQFSSRKREIDQAVGRQASAATKAKACTTTRKEKVHKAIDERNALKEKWQEQARSLRINHPPPNPQKLKNEVVLDHRELIDQALEVVTEKQVAVPRHILLRETLRQSQGRYHLPSLEAEINNHPDLIQTQDGRLTTQEAINREKQILQLARSAQGKYPALGNIENAQHHAQKLRLNQVQAHALSQFISSHDGVILCQGDAGVGKTYTVKALKESIDPGIGIRGLAPSATAAAELNQGADINSQTIDSYLQLPSKSLSHSELIVVDEAGMISSSQMKRLVERATQTKSRLLLIGDTKQLAAVQAGSPFKLLQEAAKLPVIRIDQNIRQQNFQLKEVVNHLATGEVEEGYQKLHHQGRIKQIPIDSLRLKAIVTDYLDRDTKTQSQTLVLAGTNKEKASLTKRIRQGLITKGDLGDESCSINILKAKELDKFSFTQASSYEVGDVIKFGYSSARFNKDLYYRVDAIDSFNQTLVLRDSYDTTQTLKLSSYKNRAVFQSQVLELRVGEQMKFTRNHYQNQKKCINGQPFNVLNLTDQGQIKIKTKGKVFTVNPDDLLYSDYRYVDTVHGSQGKTANYCIYAAESGKSLTVNQESFYVAASRARKDFQVYTASTKALGLSVTKSRAQENALSLINKHQPMGQQISAPTREQEFNLLVSAKYLLANQGIANQPLKPRSTTYISPDGTEIKQDAGYLSIKQRGKVLIFNRENVTVKNTFNAQEIKYQIQARAQEVQQHLHQASLHHHSRTISR